MATGPEVLTQGPPRYAPDTPWSPLAALGMTALIALGPGILALAVLILAMPGIDDAGGGQSFMSLAKWEGIAFAASVQILSLILVWTIAGGGGQRSQVLRMTGERFTLAFYATAVLLLLLVTGILEFILYRSFSIDIFADTAWLREGLTSPTAIGTFVIAVILAPLWEELAFRGFLLSALAKTPLGFWGGALIANVLWTSLHGTYSWAGVISVFVAGLILSWLVWRTGSIKPAIVTHAIGNLFALAFTYGFAPVQLPVPA
jgi:membrane protease YdiL (CAAX protease family)